MEPLIVLAATFALLWVLFIRPQQRRVRGHQQLIAALEPGDQVVLTAGIYGRIVDLGPEDMTVEVAPGIELRVARQAVLRRVEDATTLPAEPTAAGIDVDDQADLAEHDSSDHAEHGTLDPTDQSEHGTLDPTDQSEHGTLDPTDQSDDHTDAGGDAAAPQPDDRGPAAPGSPATS